MSKIKVTCEIEITLLAMGEKWKPLILYYLTEGGTKRFGEIYSITEKGLTLFPILELMCEWGEKNTTDNYEIINPQCDC